MARQRPRPFAGAFAWIFRDDMRAGLNALPPLAVILGLSAAWAAALVWTAWAGLRVAGLGDLAATLALLVANALLYRFHALGDRAAALLSGFTIFFALAGVSGVFSYLVGSIGRPFADPWLARADAALGFDWLAWRDFVQARPPLRSLLSAAYASMIPQALLGLIAFPLAGMAERSRELLACLAVALVPTLGLFALFPAESAWVHYAVEPGRIPPFLADLNALRSGALPVMNLQRLDGLITFPSFHTAVAVLMVHAARGTTCFWLAIVVNALMILSTFTEGGHYLVDVVAGAAIALLAIGVVSAAHPSRSPDGDRT